ncbi:response regulator [Nitrospirota bacterium]
MTDTNEQGSILIVEDEYLLAMDIQFTLEDTGYKVMGIALSGEEALEQLERDLPDLVLMDITLYGNLDGIETAKQIHKRFNIPVVFMTGNADKLTTDNINEINPVGFIHKPIIENELMALLEKHFLK